MTNRRSFLKGSLGAAAALSLPAKIHAQAPGSNDAIRVGVVGFRGRGQNHISDLLASKGVRITAICDADQGVLDKGYEQLSKKGQTVSTYLDMRKMFDSKEVDAITTATPNHWHSLAAIWALQAGKDVYVEKPVSHNVWEGGQVIAAARKYQRICQTGTQSRSSGGLHAAHAWVKAGNLGKLKYAVGTCYKRRASIGKVDGPQPWPKDVDKDLWHGPAPLKDLTRKQLHYDWHWVWDTGNGDLGNQGIHQMDIARWFMGVDALSPSVLSIGGRLGYIDDAETANTQLIVHGYEPAPLYFDVRGLPEKPGANNMDKWRGSSIGVVLQYEKGHVVIPSYTEVIAFDADGKEIRKFKEGMPDVQNLESHMQNFLNACRTRKHTDLFADIREGHLSSALCHTGNISYRLGKKAEPGDIRDAVKADAHASETIGRMIEHLKINEVDVEKDQLTLGVPLKMDPKTERFIGNAAADKMLTREYRKPYVVPEKV